MQLTTENLARLKRLKIGNSEEISTDVNFKIGVLITAYELLKELLADKSTKTRKKVKKRLDK